LVTVALSKGYTRSFLVQHVKIPSRGSANKIILSFMINNDIVQTIEHFSPVGKN